jgi:hypothetical protein
VELSRDLTDATFAGRCAQTGVLERICEEPEVENALAGERHAAGPAPEPRHFNQAELARRWRISPRTLERWRWRREGPRYLKMGGRIVYRSDDVTAYEDAQARDPGSELARLAAAKTAG